MERKGACFRHQAHRRDTETRNALIVKHGHPERTFMLTLREITGAG
ncbi:MAG: hypothetical protein K2H92_08450 [Bacteroidaceae bacterium]|nr:hypothetical protein [Bacteroidaceae bacterium]